jgi:1,4-alpha-glucan branching enzyme
VAVEFSFDPAGPAQTVHVTGDFANWDPAAIPMSDPDGDGVYTAHHSLAPGDYQYKFVVDGAQWFEDPNNPDHVEDNHGGHNSVLRVGPGN